MQAKQRKRQQTGKRPKRTRRLADYAAIFLHHRASPEQVARGACVGLFVGLSPLYGLQVVLCLLLAALLRASKIAALLAIWVTNPLTLVPVYSFTYWTGSKLLGSPVREKPFREFLRYCFRNLRWENLDEARGILGEVLRLGKDILPALFAGGLAVAALCSLPAYPLLLAVVRRYRELRSRHILARRQRKQRAAP